MLPKLFDLRISESGYANEAEWVRFGAAEDTKTYIWSEAEKEADVRGWYRELPKKDPVWSQWRSYVRPTWWKDDVDGAFPQEVQYASVVLDDGEDNWRTAAESALGKNTSLPRPHSVDESKDSDASAAGVPRTIE